MSFRCETRVRVQDKSERVREILDHVSKSIHASSGRAQHIKLELVKKLERKLDNILKFVETNS
jgi:hypothetical protein